MRRHPYTARQKFVMAAELATPVGKNVLGCYACGWTRGNACFPARPPRSVRVGCLPRGSEGQHLDRFPAVEAWIWGGHPPAEGDWRIVDVKHPPEPEEVGGGKKTKKKQKKRGRKQQVRKGEEWDEEEEEEEGEAVARKELWRRSDANMPFPEGFVPRAAGTGRRFWPAGRPPVCTLELCLRRFCMDCGARAGVHAIKDKVSVFGVKKAKSEDDGGADAKADRWICACRMVRKYAMLNCEVCGLSCTLSKRGKDESDEDDDEEQGDWGYY